MMPPLGLFCIIEQKKKRNTCSIIRNSMATTNMEKRKAFVHLEAGMAAVINAWNAHSLLDQIQNASILCGKEEIFT